MEAGIVGLPNVGKSTLFNALTLSKAAASENYPFCTIEPNEGMVSVPDGRLQRITKYIVPQNVIPAALKLVDIAGIVKGASEGEGLGNKFLSHIRQVDAILQVVRCFEDDDVIHVSGTVNPIADIETIEIELTLADMEAVASGLEKAKRSARTGDKEAILRLDVLTRCNEHLEKEQPLRTLELNPAEAKNDQQFWIPDGETDSVRRQLCRRRLRRKVAPSGSSASLHRKIGRWIGNGLCQDRIRDCRT